MIFCLEFFRREGDKKTIKKAKNDFLVKSLIGILVFCLAGSFFVGKVLGEDETDKLKGKIWINEIAWMGTKESYSDEWIEIYNSSDKKVDLDNWRIEAKDGNPEIVLEGVIEPQGYKVFDITYLHNDGEELSFLNDTDYCLQKVDAVDGWSAGNKDSKRTMERIENGEWQTSQNQGGTPGKENSDGLEEDKEEDAPDLCNSEKHPEILSIEINEILPNPDKDAENKKNRVEWVELHNPGKEEVLLSGCYIGDKANMDKEKIEDKKIKPGEYLILEIDGLNNSGEEKVYFADGKKEEIDSQTYRGSIEGQSFALDKDGDWSWTEIITPEDQNEFPKPKECSSVILISEIFPDPKENESENEWIELYNSGNKQVSLKGCYLADEHLLGKENPDDYFNFSEEDKIGAGEYFVIKRGDFGFGMNNGGETVSLRDRKNKAIDEIKYEDAEEGYSYAINKEKKRDWTRIITPGEKNEFPEPVKYPGGVEITEFLPNAEGADKGKEWIELFNNEKKKVDLSDWKIENQSGRDFEIENLSISSKERKALKIKDSSFSIRNSGGWISLIDPNGTIVDRVEYKGPAKPESSFNKTQKESWEWSHFLTPGDKNQFNKPPQFKIDKPDDFYEDIRVHFEVDDLEDSDEDEIKFRWDFGDGHRSYKKETAHIYEDEGVYEVEIRVSDPSVDVFKKFEIKVEDYPDYELEIVKLIPNPKGRDSEKEKIWIKNNSDEDVNLRGWSVATGKSMDNLSNHPIREDFEIEEGEVEDLERDDCAFALLNKKGIVILRYPDGDRADKVKYEKEKIEEDELYILKDGTWKWKLPSQNKMTNKIKSAATQANQENQEIKNQPFLVDEIIADKKSKQSMLLPRLVFENWIHGEFAGRIWSYLN